MRSLPDPASLSYRLLFSLPVIVAALGYFVDVYDLLLLSFNIVRVPSLKSFHLDEQGVLLMENSDHMGYCASE